MSKKDNKIKEVLLNILILFLYFIWPYLSNIVISNDNIIVSFISNMIISIIIIIFFRKKLKKDILKFNKQFLKNILYCLKWCFISLVIFLSLNQIIYIIIPNVNLENTNIILNMYKDNIWLLFINTFICFSLVEELIFKIPFKNIIKNKWLFIIFTGFLNAFYTVYLTATNNLSLLFIISYTVLISCFSYVYYKKDNIVFAIITRIFYNLITILVLLS